MDRRETGESSPDLSELELIELDPSLDVFFSGGDDTMCPCNPECPCTPVGVCHKGCTT
jgi:hypothetical protein